MANEVQDIDLQNAKIDLANIAAIVNGSATDPDVQLRLGGSAMTLRKVAALIAKGDKGDTGNPGVNGQVTYAALATLMQRLPSRTLLNLYDKNKTTPNAAYNSRTQTLNTTANGLRLSNKLLVTSNGKFTVNVPMFTDGGDYGVAYFDGNDVFVANDATQYTAASNTITAPNNPSICYALFSTWDSGSSQYDVDFTKIMVVWGTTLPSTFVDFGAYSRSEVDAKVNVLPTISDVAFLAAVTPIAGANQLFNAKSLELVNNGVLQVGGQNPNTIQPLSGWTVSGRTFAKPNMQYICNVDMFGDGDRYGRSFEDAHGTILAVTTTDLPANTPAAVPNVPGIVCMRFNIMPNTNLMTVMVNAGTVALPFETFGTYAENIIDNKIQTAVQPSPFRAPRRLGLKSTDKIVLYNDSISSSLYPWYRQALIDLTGADVYNDGTPGQNAAHFAVNNSLNQVFNRSPRLIILLIGGNDTGAPGTVGSFNGSVIGEPIQTPCDISKDYAVPNNGDGSTGGQDNSGYQGNTFIQATDYAVRYILNFYANPRAKAGLTGNEDEATKNAMIAAVPNPMLLLCTTLPQNRTNAQDPSSLAANRRRLAQAAIEVGIKNQVHTIDLYSMTAFRMAQEVFFDGQPHPTITTNNGVYFLDGLHPNQFGARRIAEHIVTDSGQ